jgi:NADH-quinone oxidoreductase subunit M
MASLGLPGLAGFWGEFPAVLSTFNPGGNLSQPLFRTYMVIAAIGTVLAAGYLLWMLQKVAFGTPKPEFANAHIHDVNAFEWTAWVPILLLIVALGIFPNIIFRVTDDAVSCQTAAPFVSKTTVPISSAVKCPASPVAAQVTAKVSGG